MFKHYVYYDYKKSEIIIEMRPKDNRITICPENFAVISYIENDRYYGRLDYTTTVPRKYLDEDCVYLGKI